MLLKLVDFATSRIYCCNTAIYIELNNVLSKRNDSNIVDLSNKLNTET